MKLRIATILTLLSAFSGPAYSLIGGSPHSGFKSSVHFNEICTASKISKDVFIIAAHCVVNFDRNQIKSEFAERSRISLRNSVVTSDVTIKKVLVHPLYLREMKEREGYYKLETGFEATDVAMVKINESTPQIPIAKLDFGTVLPNEKIWIGGYGCEVSGNKSIPHSTPKLKMALVSAIHPSQVKNKYGNGSPISAATYNFYTSGKMHDLKSASLCPGDSGGPVYRNGAVVGINSNYFFIDRSGISFANIHAKLNVISSWLQSNL